MLDQAVNLAPTIGQIHIAARERLTDRHMFLMEKLQKENVDKKKYWILGSSKSSRRNGRTSIKAVLKVYDIQPEVQKESYLYEVDNIQNTTTLVWVMHPNKKLSLPSIGKTISVAG